MSWTTSSRYAGMAMKEISKKEQDVIDLDALLHPRECFCESNASVSRS